MILSHRSLSAGAVFEIVRYMAPRPLVLEAADVNSEEDAPCMAIQIASMGAEPENWGSWTNRQGITLAEGTPNVPGGSVIWNGQITLDIGEMVIGCFQQATSGMYNQLNVKVRPR